MILQSSLPQSAEYSAWKTGCDAESEFAVEIRPMTQACAFPSPKTVSVSAVEIFQQLHILGFARVALFMSLTNSCKTNILPRQSCCGGF